MRILQTIFLTLLSFTNACKILSLSGGGVYGAFEMGIVSNLLEKNKTWDLFTGVSAGSLNTAYLSSIPIEEQKYLIPEYKTLWSDLKDSDVFEYIYFLNGLSILDTRPLLKTVEKVYSSKKPINQVLISATSLSEAGAKIFDNKDILEKGFVDILMSSTAIPILFPPYQFGNDTYVDGGLTSNILLTEGINWCAKNMPGNSIEIDAIIAGKVGGGGGNFELHFSTLINRLIYIIQNQFEFSEIFHPILLNSISITVYELKNDLPYSLIDFSKASELFTIGYSFENVNEYILNQNKKLKIKVDL